MSYLDTPRLHIFGGFYTDPSTINNDPTHYEVDCDNPSPWQEPEGKHDFRFQDCKITSVLDADGNSAYDDPLLGAAFTTAAGNRPAKIIDLDVYQQGVSTIFGMLASIALSGGALTGSVVAPVLQGVWFQRVLPTRGWSEDYGWGSYGGDTNASGAFQSRILVPESDWPSGISKVLDQLREKSDVVDGNVILSFRFTLDAYINVPGDSRHRTGRATAAIGPARRTEPVQAHGSRWLNARPLPDKAAWTVPALYGAPFRVDESRKKLVVDLANSLCMQKPGGASADMGTLEAFSGGTKLGAVDYNTYERSAGIAEVDLDDAQLQAVKQQPVQLKTSRTDIGPQTLFEEDSSGIAWAADQRSIRMTSEDPSALRTVQTSVYVTKWGEPLPGVQLDIVVIPVEGSTPGATVPPTNPGDTESAKGALTATISTTDANGKATVTLKAVKDPGSRTPQLDGQLYFVYPYRQSFDPKVGGPQEQRISVVLWSSYAVKDQPAWSDVQTMMVPYAKLYPSMTQKVDLTSEHAFKTFANNPPWVAIDPNDCDPVDGLNVGAIGYYLTRDMDDRRYMPITRDLSPNKIKTILNWIKNQLPPPPPSAPPTGGSSSAKGSS